MLKVNDKEVPLCVSALDYSITQPLFIVFWLSVSNSKYISIMQNAGSKERERRGIEATNIVFISNVYFITSIP